MRPPSVILRLLLYKSVQIHASVELICLRPWIADPPLVVQVFGNLSSQQPYYQIGQHSNLHHPLTIHSEEPATELLQLNGSQRQGPPFACGPLLQLGDFGETSSETSLEKQNYRHAIE